MTERGSVTMTLEEFDQRINPPVPAPDMRLRQLQIGPAISLGVEYENFVSPLAMLLMRLGWGPFDNTFGHTLPTDFLGVHKQNDKVLVFIAGGGGHVVLEDDAALYPSDSLITRLRMLAEAYKKGSESGS